MFLLHSFISILFNQLIKDHGCENVYFKLSAKCCCVCNVNWKERYRYHFTHNSISWTLSAPNRDVTILPIMMITTWITILPLTVVGWTGRSAHTLEETKATYHPAKTPGAVPVSGQDRVSSAILVVDRCPIVHLSSSLISARFPTSVDLDCSAAT